MDPPIPQPDILPARAVNAHVFCPRLFWLEQVESYFEHNEHTIEGKQVHERVDKPGGAMPAPDAGQQEDAPPWHTRSLWLSSAELGVTGKLDLAEEKDGIVMPVDTKKGKPDPNGRLWPADRVQLALQGLLLRSAGYRVDDVAAWYHATRRRVCEPLTAELEAEARAAVLAARATAAAKSPPPPLIDSPKCFGCSLNAICLPDEVNALGYDHIGEQVAADEPMRRVQPPRDEALPVYVQSPGARIGLSHGALKIVTRDPEEKPSLIGLERISQLDVMGPVQVTTQALQACLRAEIPVCFFSSGGYFYGRTDHMGARQVHVRIAQHRAYGTDLALCIARGLIADKLANQRTLLRRNAAKPTSADPTVGSPRTRRIKALIGEARHAPDPQRLLGAEGEGAKIYFQGFSELVASTNEDFRMGGRNRRPPRDRTNSLLSFGYALLVKDTMLAVLSVGLDGHLGMYHTPHHGRPSLALDLMEPFRPLIVDSVVLQLIRRKALGSNDFVISGQAVTMSTKARKTFVQAYERRMDELVTHPTFGYRISYRRVIHVQARLLSRVLLGEITMLPAFQTR